jgi:hypothetical protein
MIKAVGSSFRGCSSCSGCGGGYKRFTPPSVVRMNGLFINCAIATAAAASTVAAGTLILEKRLAAEGNFYERMMSNKINGAARQADGIVNQALLHGHVAEAAVGDKMRLLEMCGTASIDSVVAAEKAASIASVAAVDAHNTSATVRTWIAEQEKIWEKKYAEQDAKIQAIEARVHQCEFRFALAGSEAVEQERAAVKRRQLADGKQEGPEKGEVVDEGEDGEE